MEIRKHRHLGSYGVIIKNNKILLIKKSRGAYTGKLDLPGGSFEHAETPEQCVVREVMEETGLNVKELKLFDAISINLQWQDAEEIEDLHHIGIIYMVDCLDSIVKTDSDGQDSLGANWYDIEKLKKQDLSPFVEIILKKMSDMPPIFVQLD